MKKIFLLQKEVGRYGTSPKILRAFESRVEAEDIIDLMKGADVDCLEIFELDVQEARPHKPLPIQTRVFDPFSGSVSTRSVDLIPTHKPEAEPEDFAS